MILSSNASSDPAASRAWRHVWRCCDALAVVCLATALLLCFDCPRVAVVAGVHALGLWVAARLRRPGMALVLLASALLAVGLAYLRVVALVEPYSWRVIAVAIAGPILGFVLGDLSHARWHESARALRRPRVHIGMLVLVVAVTGFAMWWQTSPARRASYFLALGNEEQAIKILLDGPAERTPLGRKLLFEVALQVDPHVTDLLGEAEDWPWIRCVAPANLPPPAARLQEDLEYFDSILAHSTILRDLYASMGERAWVVSPRTQNVGLFGQAGLWAGTNVTSGSSLSTPVAGASGLLQIFRLGHLPDPNFQNWRGRPGVTNTDCVFCGPITGPAVGVTEHADGSLTWRDDDGRQRTAQPPSWDPDWAPAAPPRPTMPMPLPLPDESGDGR